MTAHLLGSNCIELPLQFIHINRIMKPEERCIFASGNNELFTFKMI